MQAKIQFFGEQVIVCCDGKCNKAWGISSRPLLQCDKDNEDDVVWLADSELGAAPKDPGTYEGGHGKLQNKDYFPNKWCVRECERSCISKPNEKIILPDYSKRVFNIPSLHK